MPKRRLPPGPPTGFLGVANAQRLGRELLEFPTEMARQYGDLTYFRMGPVRAFLVAHPELVHEVLVTQAKSFRKIRRVIEALAIVDGQGLVLSDGELWRRQRRLLQPTFSSKRFAGYGDITVETTRESIAGWSDGATLDIDEEMTRVSSAIIARSLFGLSLGPEVDRITNAVREVSEIITRRTSQFVPIPYWFPTSDNRRIKQSVRLLHSFIDDVIRQRRASSEDRGDLLSMLLLAVDDEGDGRGMSDRQARDEAITMFNAGHDSTAASLTWTWYLLATNPPVEERLRREIADVLGDRTPTFADVAQLKVAALVVKESMRLFPPTWSLIPRETVEDVHLGGYVLPKRSWIYIYPWVLHHDPRFFPNPERFDPERFAPGRVESIPQHAYIPFGAGPHVCIGSAFATMEMVLILATVMQRFRITLPTRHAPVVPEPLISIRPRGGLTMTLERAVPGGQFAGESRAGTRPSM